MLVGIFFLRFENLYFSPLQLKHTEWSAYFRLFSADDAGLGEPVAANNYLAIGAQPGSAGDILVQGSQLKAGGDLSLDASRDILLQSAQNTQSTDSKNSSRGGGIGGQFAGNMANGMLAGLNDSGSAHSTTKAAVSEGTIIIRDPSKQKQDVAGLSRDVANANPGLDVIFDKEKEQNRLKAAQLIGEIGAQAGDIARTQGQIAGMKAKADPAALAAAREELVKKGKLNPTADEIAKQAYDTAMNPFGTGSSLQQGISAVTAAVQGLSGGNVAQAISGASAPYLAEKIHELTTDANGKVNIQANLMAHAVLGAVTSYAAGNAALAGASGAVMGEYIAQQMYPGVKREDLSEEQRQTISALGTLAAGLAGGVVGDSTADAVAGAQAGKTSLENNALSDIAQAQSEGKTPEQKAGEYVEAENERYKKANCGGMSAEACSVKMYEERREALKDMASLGADFVPVVGDIKSFAEAQSALDYLVAAIGTIPGAGDAAGKVIRAAETALKKGDVAEASKLINKASDEISAYSSATYPKLKEDLIQQNLNNIAKQDPRLAAVVKGDNGKLNYGVGTGTKEEADRLGKIWVGDGARPTSDGTGLVSADGTRIYRSPKEKPNAPDSLNPTGTQANFESYTKNIETGKMDKTGNGHLNISGENK
ncbi:VENN motif pre-toxin domain-containing protein [Pantoea agglomerans]|uniref:VENN motif pre-toxin domain-containing protein n=1 Tax=Enterobacter agglomerans TaxID=549 RepID=UPI00301C0960